jgi:hypothetical protein
VGSPHGGERPVLSLQTLQITVFLSTFPAQIQTFVRNIWLSLLAATLPGMLWEEEGRNPGCCRIHAVSAGIQKAFNSLESKGFVDTTARVRNRSR